MDSFTKKISSSLNEMRRIGIGTDMVIVSQEKRFPAHQFILSAASPYLKRRIETEITENNTNELHFSSVNAAILNSILEFIYLSDPGKLQSEKLEDLMELYHLAHLFQIQELLQFCRQLIDKQINPDNYQTIWRMRIKYNEGTDCENILSYVIENLKTIALKADFLNLSYDQMKMVLKRSYERQIPTEDYLLSRIVAWMNEDALRKENIDLFHYLNFERVTHDCMRLLEKENIFFKVVLRKLHSYFKFHVFPKLITDEGIKSLRSNRQSVHQRSLLKIILTGHYLEISNNVISDKYEVMKIVEVQPFGEIASTHLIRLGISMKNFKLGFQSNSLFYFITQDSSRMSVTGYDYKSNSVSFNVDLSENISVLGTCCSSQKLYIVGHKVKSDPRHLSVFCLSESKGVWSSYEFSSCFIEGEFVACFNLDGFLHVLCRKTVLELSEYELASSKESCKDNEVTNCYSLNKLLKNSSHHPKTNFPSLKTKFTLDKKFVIVQRKKLYAFVFEDSKCTCFELDPKFNHWNRYEITTLSSDAKKIYSCYSTKEYGILFYTYNSLLQFDDREHSIKPFLVDVSNLDSDSRFIKEINSVTGKVFIIPEEEEEINFVNEPVSEDPDMLRFYRMAQYL